jgi:hypothetical protein
MGKGCVLAECEWFNKNLKGCNVNSFVYNFNKLCRVFTEPQPVKTRHEYEEKHAGETPEEIKNQLFSGGKHS